MLSLDKAIAQEKELFEHCKRLYEPLSDEDKSINPLLKNEIEYHEQLAEWLEELKVYRECNVCEYNKAIDDFISLIESKRCIRYTRDYVIELAEQLRAGGTE